MICEVLLLAFFLVPNTKNWSFGQKLVYYGAIHWGCIPWYTVVHCSVAVCTTNVNLCGLLNLYATFID